MERNRALNMVLKPDRRTNSIEAFSVRGARSGGAKAYG
jgi:hypothetical protein